MGEPAHPARRFSAFARRRWDTPTLLSFVVLAALLLLNILIDPNFFTGFSLTTFFTDAVPLVLVAAGQFAVILTGGIDLSVGSVLSIANVFVATHMASSTGSMAAVAAGVLLFGALAGWVNGLAVHYGRIQPILVTLATMSIYEGIALVLLPNPGGTVPAALTNDLTGTVFGVPVAVLILAALAGLWAWAQRTRFVLHLVALGSDEAAARMNGVRIGVVKMGAYVLSGFFAAASGLYLAAETTSGDPNVGAPLTLLSIAAVVIGGTRLSGGRGNLFGVMAGALVLSILGSIMFFAHVSSYYQNLFQGLILLVAVGLSSWRRLSGRYMKTR